MQDGDAVDDSATVIQRQRGRTGERPRGEDPDLHHGELGVVISPTATVAAVQDGDGYDASWAAR